VRLQGGPRPGRCAPGRAGTGTMERALRRVALLACLITWGSQHSEAQEAASASSSHAGGAGVEVAGNFVPWGANLCLTPDDAVAYVDLCSCGEGFECASLYCDYLKINVNYTEYNAAGSPVEGPYTNQVSPAATARRPEPEMFFANPLGRAPIQPVSYSLAPTPNHRGQ